MKLTDDQVFNQWPFINFIHQANKNDNCYVYALVILEFTFPGIM